MAHTSSYGPYTLAWFCGMANFGISFHHFYPCRSVDDTEALLAKWKQDPALEFRRWGQIYVKRKPASISNTVSPATAKV